MRISGDEGSFQKRLMQRSPLLAKGLAAYQVAAPLVRTAVPLLKQARDWYEEKTEYEIRVSQTDEMYRRAHAWVMSLMTQREQHSVEAVSEWSMSDDFLDDLELSSPATPVMRRRQVVLRYSGTKSQVIRIAGYRVKVTLEESSFDAETRGGEILRPENLVFTVSSLAARNAVIKALGEATSDEVAVGRRRPSLHLLSSSALWDTAGLVLNRSLESVALKEGQRERIVADLERFIGAEQDYLRRGIPWHRGYLFHGPPGTGKTSLVKAIANHLGFDLWCMPLGDLKTDADLNTVMAKVGWKSILLLEDADVFEAATKRDGGSRASLAGLLNALDGVVTPHGLIVIMTTNHRDTLDPALMRPGRIDVTEHLGECDAYQAAEVVRLYYDDEEVFDANGAAEAGELLAGWTAAEIMEVCKQHDDPGSAVEALMALAELRRLEEKLGGSKDDAISDAV